jgi:hypothetical protein
MQPPGRGLLPEQRNGAADLMIVVMVCRCKGVIISWVGGG